MLSQHGMPFRRDVLKRALANSFERSGSISSALWCDRGVDGIKFPLVNVPAAAVSLANSSHMYALLYKS